MNAALPPPSAAALAASAELSRLIGDRIAARSGWIPFSEYMEGVLYAPGLGYYTGGAQKLGPAGDFVTAPGLSPLFGGALARQLHQVMDVSGAPLILELGAGSGALAVDILQALERIGALPERYRILDVSGELRARQADRIAKAIPALADRVEWLDGLPECIEGAVIANEVLDALPVELLVKTETGWALRGVTQAAGGFAFEERTASPAECDRLVGGIPDSAALCVGYTSEVNVAAQALVTTLVARLRAGALLFIDYGFPALEFYHPQRDRGTLMCHYRHRAHGDPFLWPGLQDLTAHIDFSAVKRAALEAKGDILGYTTQARFLINCGILDLLESSPENPGAWLAQTNAVQRLLSEAEMGELFKVIAIGRGIHGDLLGFLEGDRSAVL